MPWETVRKISSDAVVVSDPVMAEVYEDFIRGRFVQYMDKTIFLADDGEEIHPSNILNWDITEG
jgi:hypothetical protein